MYAVGSVHEKFDVWIGVAPQSNWPTGHVELNSRVDPNNVSNLIDSNVDLVMHSIGAIRFGSWKVRRLNRT